MMMGAPVPGMGCIIMGICVGATGGAGYIVGAAGAGCTMT